MLVYWLIGMMVRWVWHIRTTYKFVKLNKGQRMRLNIQEIVSIVLVTLSDAIAAWLWPIEIIANSYYMLKVEDDDDYKL